MKLSLISVSIFATTLFACAPNITYAHTKDADYLTVESRTGDNLDDYRMLHAKANEMCLAEGKKDGVVVLDSRPGAYQQKGDDRPSPYYTLMYQCKEPSLTDKATELAKKVKDMAASIKE